MSKKSNGEGSITKRSDGRYMGRYTIDGKRKTVYGTSRTEVRKSLNKIFAEIDSGNYVEPQKITIGEWLQTWLEEYTFGLVKQSTYVSYEAYIRLHLNPGLGNINITQLTTEKLQHFFNSKRETHSAKTIRNIFNMLHTCLDQAVINKKIEYNPTFGVKLPKMEPIDLKVLSVEEQTILQQTVLQASELHAFGIIFALNTGVRLGELLGLQWKDISFQNQTVSVNRTLGRLKKVDKNGKVLQKDVNGVYIGNTTEIAIRKPKSRAGIRTIPLFEEIYLSLLAYKKVQQQQIYIMGSMYDNQDFVFCMPTGKPTDPKVYDDLFKRILKRANMRDINFHGLRHTFATRALEAGMDIKALAAIMGHAQPSTTLNRYGRVLDDHKRTSMDKMRSFYQPPFNAYSEQEADHNRIEGGHDFLHNPEASCEEHGISVYQGNDVFIVDEHMIHLTVVL